MNILVVDDEPLALEYLAELLYDVFELSDEKQRDENEQKSINTFTKCKESISYAEEIIQAGESIDYAFLDIKMRGMLGLELAKIFKEVCPSVKIIFVTGYKEYSFEAYQMHAAGYIFKPADKERIIEVLESINTNWRDAVGRKDECKIVAQTFGNFEIFSDNVAIEFRRSKAKELLAYLIDRRGATMTTAQLCAMLWEDKEYNFSMQRQFQTIVTEMMKALKEVDAEQIIVKKRNSYAIDTTKIKCDYYDYIAGDAIAVNSYMGEYMSQYSWAEFSMSEFLKG